MIIMRYEVTHQAGQGLPRTLWGRSSDESGAKALRDGAIAAGCRFVQVQAFGLPHPHPTGGTMKLNLTKRQAKCSSSINTRTQRHGDDEVPGVDIPVTGILLTPGELNEMLEDPAAHDHLYAQAGEGGAHVSPRWPVIGRFPIDRKFKDAKATIKVDDIDCVMKPCKLDKIFLELQEGGLTAMSCTVKGVPPEHLDVLGLLNRKCTIAILGAQIDDKRGEDQQELPLSGAEPNRGGEDDEEDGEAEEGDSFIGRRIRASEAKKGRKGKKRG